MGKSFRGRPLSEVAPDIASQWHPELNKDAIPENTSSGASRKAWWICEAGHEWEAVIASRVSGKFGCPYCSGKYVLTGYNDLKTLNPELASEWHPTKNGALLPSEVPKGGSRKVWWLGKCGHEWEATIGSRATGTGCGYCANQKVLVGFNDLPTRQPELIQEWHPNKNHGISPTEVISGSNKKYWWVCEAGHEWQASPAQRRKSGCGVCSGKIFRQGVNDLATRYPEIAKKWHPTKNGGAVPSEISPTNRARFWWQCEQNHEWQAVPGSLVYSKSSGCPVCSGQKVMKGVNDLKTTDPEIVREWHPDFNMPLKPDEITRGTRRKVWWKCESGHEWQAIIANRTVLGNKCPYCQHQWVLEGENDLEALAPKIAAEWHPSKNANLRPSEVFATSGKKYWWMCKSGHEWEAKVSNRSSHGLGCPVCSNQQLLTGYNDLKTLNPELASEWHPTKNNDVLPTQIPPHSDLKAWWLGACGHQWQADVGSRSMGNGCPYCSNQKTLAGYNDILTTHPELASQWHPKKNLPLKPNEVVAGSNKKVWWLGKCGHEWEAAPGSRAIETGDGCPICRNLEVLTGFNDLATVAPHLVLQLHPIKNGNLDPSILVGHSAKKYWWVCDEGHEWFASSGARLRGTGCPKCSKGGYDQASEGYLYLLRKEELSLQQFGISNSPEQRLARHKRNGWELLDAIGPADGLWILQTETALKRFFRAKNVLLPKYYLDKFDGYSESWNSSEVRFSSVSEMLSALRDFEDQLGHS